jgi:hypothetical protein
MGGVNPFVSALAVSGNTLYAGGTFTNAGGVSANFIAQWNGNNWSALGSGMNGSVEALAVSGNTLYAGGAFLKAGGKGSSYAAEANLGPPPLTLSMPTGLAGGGFQVTVNGLAGQTYTVQMSTNLSSTNWMPLWVTNSSSSVFLFIDPNATGQQRFYRVEMGP